MPPPIDQVRRLLTYEPLTAQQIMEKAGISQPTLSRVMAVLEAEVVRFRVARTIHYALRDRFRTVPEFPVYLVAADGTIQRLGLLVPVRHEGFVMVQDDGTCVHSEGLPWWLVDMRPQGFMGRAYAARHAATLGLPTSIAEWSDSHALRALLAHGQDAVGNLLLGDLARDRFVHAPEPRAIPLQGKGAAYVRLAREVANSGDSWSSAAGEQPKFASYAETGQGNRHHLVKFTLPEDNPFTQRWRDLLLAEHHALQTLHAAGIAAARSTIIDCDGQRFLEVERFDRVGPTGRCGIYSLAAVDAEFTGLGRSPWPVVTAALAAAGPIERAAHQGAQLLYAFGTLIGNTDMHHGNLSFTAAPGQPHPPHPPYPPFQLAPAYDMLPMGLQPLSGGALRDTLNPATLHAAVAPALWRQAQQLAGDYLQRLRQEQRFSDRFTVCLDSLERHLAEASGKIARLGGVRSEE